MRISDWSSDVCSSDLLGPPRPLATAYTISLADPAVMEAAARNAAAAGYALLKVKLGGDGDMDRIAAVRRGSPAARLIVDANEAWAGLDLEAQADRKSTRLNSSH